MNSEKFSPDGASDFKASNSDVGNDFFERGDAMSRNAEEVVALSEAIEESGVVENVDYGALRDELARVNEEVANMKQLRADLDDGSGREPHGSLKKFGKKIAASLALAAALSGALAPDAMAGGEGFDESAAMTQAHNSAMDKLAAARAQVEAVEKASVEEIDSTDDNLDSGGGNGRNVDSVESVHNNAMDFASDMFKMVKGFTEASVSDAPEKLQEIGHAFVENNLANGETHLDKTYTVNGADFKVSVVGFDEASSSVNLKIEFGNGDDAMSENFSYKFAN